MVRFGRARRGSVIAAWRVGLRRGDVRHGMVRFGRQGKVLSVVVRFGPFWRGVVRQVGLCEAWHGPAGQLTVGQAWCVDVWRCVAMQGLFMSGEAGWVWRGADG